jgi:hypothetical protein
VTLNRELDAETRSAWLCDRESIKDLPLRYAQGVDGRDWGQVRSCFADDAVAAGILFQEPIGPYLEKLEASVAVYQRTMHVIANQLVDLTAGADTAQIESYAVAFHIEDPAERRDNLEVGVVYRDTVVRTATGWLISARAVEAKWIKGPMPRPA